MAEIAVVGPTEQEGTTYTHTWDNLLNGDDGERIKIPGAADRTVHVYVGAGAFGVGGSIQIEGSNKADPTVDADWVVLTDLQDADLIFTGTDAIEVIAEAPLWIRPHVTAGDGTTDLSVTILSRGTK